MSEANDASRLKTNEDRVEKRIVQDEWEKGLEFGCFATMLRMFLVLDSFILRTRFPRRSWNPISTCVSKIGLKEHIGTRSTFHFAYLNTPVIMQPKRRAILVRLPESLVDRLDSVTYDLHMRSRSDYIRRSLERALDFSETHEVPLLEDPDLQRALAR